jgi:uncharacterized protein YceK
MLKQTLAITVLIATLTGCASIVNGTNQPVSVNTGTVYGATCALENSKGKWYVNSTPGSVVVNRSYSNLTINCAKKGYRPSLKQVASKTKAMAFGNLVFGGVVGAGVDIADGAAYDYPTDINVPLQRA